MHPTLIAGRYTVERAVGHGGMGTVWLCRDEVLGRRVAVKQVGSMPGETASDVDRALREARSSAALDHPHVVSIFDAVVEDDQNWLVMEYVESRTLAEILAEEGPISPERATWIGLQAADGLAAAHARGTIHRDVKPGNILVTADDHVKIMDFGISRTHGDMALTSTGLITGTPAYFAPEIARGEDPDLQADVWALGATLYAAVEGKAPYAEQANALALLTTIATQSSPLPRRAGALTDAINRMMERDPDQRCTMPAAVAALHHLHTHGATEQRPTSPTPVEPTPAARRRPGRVLPVAVAVVFLALVAVVAVLLAPDDEIPSAADPAPSAATADPRPSGTASPDPAPEPAPAGQPTPAEEPAPVEEPEPAPVEAETGPTGDVEEFGARYYGLLPDDTGSSYALLSPSYGSSLADYEAFWSTIGGVAVRGVTAIDSTTVDVELTYTTADGATEAETRRLFLEPTDDGFRIVSDAAV